jgi:hypothetical protein
MVGLELVGEAAAVSEIGCDACGEAVGFAPSAAITEETVGRVNVSFNGN